VPKKRLKCEFLWRGLENTGLSSNYKVLVEGKKERRRRGGKKREKGEKKKGRKKRRKQILYMHSTVQ
jgi:hypothetical protein